MAIIPLHDRLTLSSQLSYKIGEKLNFNFPVTNQNNVMVDTGSVDLFLNNTKINDESIKVEHGFVIFEKELYDIEPGDYINFNSNKYQYNGLIRVMEYEVDKINEKVKITIGNSIFREKALEIYRYK